VAVYQRTSEKGTLLWCADFVGPKVGGGTRRYRLALGIDVKTKAQAKAAEARLRVDLEEEVNRGPSSPASVAPDDPVRVLAERWYAHNVAVGAWKPSTAKLYRTILDGWLLPDVGAVPLDSLDALRIDGFKASIANRGRGEKWNKSVLGVLAAMLAQGVKWRLLTANPCDQVEQFKVPEAHFDWYTGDESELWLGKAAELYPDIYPLFLTLFRAGLRLGEAFALRWDHVDLVGAQFHVRRSITVGRVGERNERVETDTKSRKARVVDMSPDLVVCLTAHRHPADLVFPDRRGRPFTREALLFQWKRITRAAGLRLLTPHDARHSYASQLVSAGAPLSYVQQQLGHSTQRMTERYAHLAPQGDRWVRFLGAPAEKKGTRG